MDRRATLVLLVVVLLAVPLFAGCVTPGARACDAQVLVRDGLVALRRHADPAGGVAASEDGRTDARTTAWVLLAAGLARRTGVEGGLDPGPHLDHLQDRSSDLFATGSPIDSVANNLSLARAALQAWGRAPDGIPVEDPEHREVRTLAGAWEARYDAEDGRYGMRLNEHLFGAFAAWLFEPPGDRVHRMAEHAAATLTEGGDDPTTRDAWWAAYARAALGAPNDAPEHRDLTARLERILDDHQEEDGGVRGFRASTTPDASTTAAALLAWHRAGETLDGPHVAPAVAWLCTARAADGSIPFRPDQPVLVAKTTAEVVVALALMMEPVPWGTAEAEA